MNKKHLKDSNQSQQFNPFYNNVPTSDCMLLSCHVRVLYSRLNVKELLALNKRDIWSLSDSNGIRTHNHLVRKGTLNPLVKLAKFG